MTTFDRMLMPSMQSEWKLRETKALITFYFARAFTDIEKLIKKYTAKKFNVTIIVFILLNSCLKEDFRPLNWKHQVSRNVSLISARLNGMEWRWIFIYFQGKNSDFCMCCVFSWMIRNNIKVANRKHNYVFFIGYSNALLIYCGKKNKTKLKTN